MNYALPGAAAAIKTQSTDSSNSALFAFLALIFGATALAFGGVFVRQSELPPTASAVYRVALAIPLLFLLDKLVAARPSMPATQPSGGAWRDLIPIGFIFSGNLALYHWSMTLTTLANSNLLANMAPIFVVVGGWIFFRQEFKKGFLIGMLMALAGAVILISARLEFGSSFFIGNMLGVVTGMFYGAYLLSVSRVRSRYSTLAVMAWSSVGTLMVLLPVAWLRHEALVPHTVHGIGVLIALALISHVAGQGLIAYALAKLPAGLSSVTLLIQPVIATALGWFLLNEHLLLSEIAGGIVILAGIAVARRHS